MSTHNITVEGGSSVRLTTAGKYCDRDIIITATVCATDPIIQPLEITENGTYTAPDGVDGYSPISVNVAGSGGSGGDLDALIDKSITEISSNLKAVGAYAFYGCSRLTTVDFPSATSIGPYAFYNCGGLKTVDFPSATSIDTYAFYGCSGLKTVDFPEATSIGPYVFSGCRSLTTVDFPAATSIGTCAFSRCGGLKTVDFPAATSIGPYAFEHCFNLTSIILRNSSQIATLSNTSVFNNCYHLLGKTNATYNPQGLKDGYIYVPSALIDTYKAATNWTTFADQFRAIEDYPDICG